MKGTSTSAKTQLPARVRRSSGNVFADLGLEHASDLLAKAKLAHHICQVISDQGLTQAKAAELMELDQPKISALMHGKLKGFSADRLFRCLNDLGQEIEITVRPVRRTGFKGQIHVQSKPR